MSQIWMLRVTNLNVISQTWRSSTFVMAFKFVTWHILMWEVAQCLPWLTHMCDMLHSYVSRNSFLCVMWLIYVCDMTRSDVWRGPFTCVTWPVYMCDMCDVAFSYVWHVSFICVTCRIHTCDMSHSYVWHVSFICVTWLIHTCVMFHLYVFHCPCMKLRNIVSILILSCALDLHVMCAWFPWDVCVTYLTHADLTWTCLHMILCRIASLCRALIHLTHWNVTWLIHT